MFRVVHLARSGGLALDVEYGVALKVADADDVASGLVSAVPADQDGDGVADSGDNCLVVPNPDQVNTDGDAFGDVCDNCFLIMNDGQLDSDGDQIGNVCDPDISDTSFCQVAFDDLQVMKLAFFSSPGDPDWNQDADLTGPAGEPEGIVNFLDLIRLKEFIFQTPGPSGFPNECDAEAG